MAPLPLYLKWIYRGMKCAGKKLSKRCLRKDNILDRFIEECRLLSQVHHPNIVQCLGVHFLQEERIPLLVMEYLPTNLTSCIKQYSTSTLPKEMYYAILHDVALGLCYLHSQTPAIIHRDLTTNNVLLTPSMMAKISDLGVARILDLTPEESSRKIMTTDPGAPYYMPPEVMMYRPEYNLSMDVFSYGILMIHVFSGELPVPTIGQNQFDNTGELVSVTEAERREVYLQTIGKDHPLMDLINKCIHNNPKLRPHASEIVEQLAKLVPINRWEFVVRRNAVLEKNNKDLREDNRKLKRALREREIQEPRTEKKVKTIENRPARQDFSPSQAALLGHHDSYDLPPNKPFSGVTKKAAVSVPGAVSPGKHIHLRSECIDQLTKWHKLMDDGVITLEEYQDVRKTIVDNIKKL